MSDYITYLEGLLFREREQRVASEEYCSLLEAQVYSLSIQLQQEQLNNIALRHMVMQDPLLGYKVTYKSL
jgi:hypothetical protein